MSLPTGQWNIYLPSISLSCLKLDRLILGKEEDRSVLRADKLEEFIHFMKSEIARCSAMMSNNAFKPMPASRHDLTSALGVKEARCILDTSFSFCFPYFYSEIFAQDKILDRPEWKEFFDKHEATGTILIVDSRASAEKG